MPTFVPRISILDLNACVRFLQLRLYVGYSSVICAQGRIGLSLLLAIRHRRSAATLSCRRIVVVKITNAGAPDDSGHPSAASGTLEGGGDDGDVYDALQR